MPQPLKRTIRWLLGRSLRLAGDAQQACTPALHSGLPSPLAWSQGGRLCSMLCCCCASNPPEDDALQQGVAHQQVPAVHAPCTDQTGRQGAAEGRQLLASWQGRARIVAWAACQGTARVIHAWHACALSAHSRREASRGRACHLAGGEQPRDRLPPLVQHARRGVDRQPSHAVVGHWRHESPAHGLQRHRAGLSVVMSRRRSCWPALLAPGGPGAARLRSMAASSRLAGTYRAGCASSSAQ